MATTVGVEVSGGPSVQVSWTQNITAQDALEAAYDQINTARGYTDYRLSPVKQHRLPS
jgi:hypothetical protein